MSVLASIPSPATNGVYVGPFFFHAYGIAYVFAVAAAIYISRRGWARVGGDPDLAYEIAMWAFPAGLIGGRIYFDITTPSQIPPHWWGIFAIWQGGLGIWGGIAAGAAVGLLVARRRLEHADLLRLMDVVAPGLLAAQAIGRIGNYFNQELFGAPSSLPWALQISPAHRPPGYLRYPTFEPTFLYELIWDLLLAAFLIWLGRHRRVRAPGLFALYVAGYSAFRIFEETQRIDYSNYFLGMRVNFFIASILCIIGLLWFAAIQRGWRGWGVEPAEPVPEAARASGPTRGIGLPRAAAATAGGGQGRAGAPRAAAATARAGAPPRSGGKSRPRSGPGGQRPKRR
ncbi:MAG TPA: prolipoprotein diacylglyceryl transferase [Solirubrobacteraceae bacterium]|nr:prolipoprotein diacylglyceryl transferase [Solirubrobacteraceae bacterium]